MSLRKVDLSIVIPFYNGKNFFLRLLHSIYRAYLAFPAQLNIEVVIVIDSTNTNKDEISLILESIIGNSFNFLIIKNSNNLGVARSRNVGIAAAIGEYITCIDQDDEVSLDYFKYLQPAVEFGYDFILINGSFYFAEKEYCVSAYYFTPKITLNNLVRFDVIRSPGQVIVKHKYLTQIGFPSPSTYFGSDDKFCWIILFSLFTLRTSYIKNKIYIGHFHNCNYSRDVKQIYRSGLELWEYIKINYPQQFADLKNLAVKNISLYEYRLGKNRSLKNIMRGVLENIFYYSYPNRLCSYLAKQMKNIMFP